MVFSLLLLLMCYSSWIPSDFRNGFTFRDAVGHWKGEECCEESAYHRGGNQRKPREGNGMHAGSWCYAGVWCEVGLGKKSPKFRWGLVQTTRPLSHRSNLREGRNDSEERKGSEQPPPWCCEINTHWRFKGLGGP